MEARHMKEAVNQQEKSRDYLFDNMRGVLIFLVVFGHMLTSMKDQYSAIKIIYVFIYFFHMPALTFISGYFSKNPDKARTQAFKTILLPYLILNLSTYLFKMLILKEQYFGFRFFRPTWGLWYLFALFLWKFFLKDLISIKYVLPFSFVFGVLSGFSKEFASYMALGRTFAFLPFFLLGYYCSKEHIEKIRRIPKIISLLIFIVVGICSVCIIKYDIFQVKNLFLKLPYPEEADVEHMFYRIFIYVIALLMIGALINITSDNKSFISKIGLNTMTVYIFHLFIVPILEKFEILNDKPYLYMAYAVVISIIITYLFSRPKVSKYYNKVINGVIGLIITKEKTD
jgi:fucose 4-O-acetylase-like acetyltransferase